MHGPLSIRIQDYTRRGGKSKFKALKNNRQAVAWGIVGFTVSLSLYSAIVALTTPNLKPLVSLQIALLTTPQIMLGVPAGVGLQLFLTRSLKQMPCPTRAAKPAFGLAASGSAFSSFLSFFGLTQVGCCSLWLLYLSLLPSVVGVGAAGFLIRYSTLLSNLSLVLVWVPVAYLIWRIRGQAHLIGTN